MKKIMNKYKMLKKTTVCGCLLLASTLASCTDWLTLYPMDKIVEENFWEDKRDLESVRNAAYANMTSSDCLTKYMVWGELRSDNFTNNPNVSISTDIQNIFDVNLKPTNNYYDYSKFYETINYCNKVLQHGPEIRLKDKSFSETEWQNMRAEMVALRALNYFYLIRVFDEVPMVFSAINDDTEVKAQAAVSQSVIMDSLVNQMEDVISVNQMPANYGNAADNKGLITNKAVHAILADIYLWRASYYHDADKAKADSNYQACINHCDEVIRLFDEEYQKNQSLGGSHIGGSSSLSDEDNPYHLIWNSGKEGVGLDESNAYNQIFGTGNSSESIFELQFNGDDVKNDLVSSYYRNSTGAAAFYPTDYAISQPAGVDAENAMFAKTDLRRWTTVQDLGQNVYCIVKYAANEIDQPSISDNTLTDERNKPQYNIRTSSNAHWIFYRLPDVLLMKAEAMCELQQDASEVNKLLNAVYKRSNPKALDTELLPLKAYGEDGNGQEELEKQILRERNREFFGEGKRWFDLMRYAMRRGYEEGPTAAYSLIQHKYSSFSTEGTIANKYKQNMKMMYSPYTETEIKANPLLVQNPIWNDQSTIQKN